MADFDFDDLENEDWPKRTPDSHAAVDERAQFFRAYYGHNVATRYRRGHGQRIGGKPHDVSGEPRDQTGKWTTGGNHAAPQAAPSQPAAQPQKKGFLASSMRQVGSAMHTASLSLQQHLHVTPAVAELALFATHCYEIYHAAHDGANPPVPIHYEDIAGAVHAMHEIGHELHVDHAAHYIANMAGRVGGEVGAKAAQAGSAIAQTGKQAGQATTSMLGRAGQAVGQAADAIGNFLLGPPGPPPRLAYSLDRDMSQSVSVRLATKLKRIRNPNWYVSLLLAALQREGTWDRAMIVADAAYPQWESENESYKFARAYYQTVAKYKGGPAGPWDESKHKRGQPDNAGQFGPGGGAKKPEGIQGGALGKTLDAPKPAAPGPGGPAQQQAAPAAPPKVKSTEEVCAELASNAFQYEPGQTIERVDMPQIVAKDVPKFADFCRARGKKVEIAQVPVGSLKGTQNEIFANKVQGMVDFVRKGQAFLQQNPGATYDIKSDIWTLGDGRTAQGRGPTGVGGMIPGINGVPGDSPPLASRDGYILDGHHRWAAQVVLDPSVPMKVLQVDENIADLLDEANDWEDVSFARIDDKEPAQTPEYEPGTPRWSGGSNQAELEPIYRNLGIDHAKALSLSGLGSHDDVEMHASSDGRGLIYRGSSQERAPDGKPIYSVQRTLYRGSDGLLRMDMGPIQVHPSMRGQGIGHRMMARAVMAAHKSGVKSIDTFAGGGPVDRHAGKIAYSLAPEMGYDAKLPKDVVAKLPPALHGTKTLQQLTKKMVGRKWWRANGRAMPMSFNPDPRGDSMRRLRVLLRHERAKRRVGPSYRREGNVYRT